MATARYWRLLLTSRQTSATSHRIMLTSVSMREHAAGPDVLLGATASASSTDALSSPARLNDGDLNTAWFTPFILDAGLVYHWVSFDLGSGGEKEVRQIELRGNNDGSGGVYYMPRTASVFFSNDGLLFTPLVTLDASIMVPGVTQVFTDIPVSPSPHRIGPLYGRLPTIWPGPAFVHRVAGYFMVHDMADSGPLSISGTVAIDDTPDIPVRRRVRLHDKPTGRLVRETWSDPVTGAYAFEKLRDGLYYVTAFDHTGNHNAVIKDAIRPE